MATLEERGFSDLRTFVSASSFSTSMSIISTTAMTATAMLRCSYLTGCGR